MRRRRRAMQNGLTAGKPAEAVDFSPATLRRRLKDAEPDSRRSKITGKPRWSQYNVVAVYAIRLKIRFRGKRKIIAVLD